MATNYDAQQAAMGIQLARAAIAQGSTAEAASRAYNVPLELLAAGLPPVYGPLSASQTAALERRGETDAMWRVVPTAAGLTLSAPGTSSSSKLPLLAAAAAALFLLGGRR